MSRAIVIVPGIMGSSLKNLDSGDKFWFKYNGSYHYQMMLKADGTSVNNVVPIDDLYGGNDTYRELYTLLYNAYHSQFDIIFYPYD